MPFNTAFSLTQPYSAPADLADRQASIARAVLALLDAPGIRPAHLTGIATIALWKWTEAAGMSPHPKYNLRYVSEGALKQDVASKIQHEHVWTRKWILQRLGDRSWDLDSLRNELATFGVARVVTAEEHGKLGGQRRQGWDRYRAEGIRVWDRQEGRWLEVDREVTIAPKRPIEEAPAAEEEEHVGELIDVDTAITTYAGPRAELLYRLVRTASFAGSVGIVQQPRDPARPPDYVRLHDTVIEEPTRAVAYVHWNGRVSLALQLDDLLAEVHELGCVNGQSHQRYGVACRVTDAASMEVAESLVALALERLRSGWELDAAS